MGKRTNVAVNLGLVPGVYRVRTKRNIEVSEYELANQVPSAAA